MACGSCGASVPQQRPTPQKVQSSSKKMISGVTASASRFGTPKVNFSFKGGRKK